MFVEDIVTTDKLGRRTGPRTRHTTEEKLRIVEETRLRGASVAAVAPTSRQPQPSVRLEQLYRRGLLDPQPVKGDAKMLPVQVGTPTMLPTERARPTVSSRSPREAGKRAPRLIEIKLSNGHVIVVRGRVDAEALSRVIDLWCSDHRTARGREGVGRRGSD